MKTTNNTLIQNKLLLLIHLTTLSTTNTRTRFLIRRLNASLALLQKFLPWMAHMMYAFLLMNLRNFSRHQKKHLQQHIMAFTTPLSYFFNLWSTYSIIMRISRQIVIIREPNANVPKWYLWDGWWVTVVHSYAHSVVNIPYSGEYSFS